MKKAAKNIFKGFVSGSLAALVTLLVIGVVLAYNDPLAHLSVPARPSQPLTVNSSPDDVLGLMLDSDQTWDSLQADYVLTNFDPKSGRSTRETQRFWLDKKGELARVEIEGAHPIIFVRGAKTLLQENTRSKVYLQTAIPGTFQYNGYNPRAWLADGSHVVYLHPFGKALPTGYYDFLYPTAIAQGLITNRATGLESVKVVGAEEVAGRQTIIISRMPKNHLYWVDAETGVILRAQYIGTAARWQVQFEAQSISYGLKIPASVFQYTPPQDARQVTPAEFQAQP